MCLQVKDEPTGCWIRPNGSQDEKAGWQHKQVQVLVLFTKIGNNLNFVFLSSSVKIVQILKRNMRRRKSTLPVEDKAAKEAAKNKMFATLSKKTGLTAREVRACPTFNTSCVG